MSRKQRITIGLICCMAGLLLLHRHQLVLGLPLFLLGFFLTSRK